jgi:hypothetical protein
MDVTANVFDPDHEATLGTLHNEGAEAEDYSAKFSVRTAGTALELVMGPTAGTRGRPTIRNCAVEMVLPEGRQLARTES